MSEVTTLSYYPTMSVVTTLSYYPTMSVVTTLLLLLSLSLSYKQTGRCVSPYLEVDQVSDGPQGIVRHPGLTAPNAGQTPVGGPASTTAHPASVQVNLGGREKPDYGRNNCAKRSLEARAHKL